jgi:nicotinate-nucleotide adenylyltransferase
MKRIGIFGGTFNPPHIAHSIVAESVRAQLLLDKIIFIPSGNPPLKESIPAEDRLAMANLAFGDDINFEISDIEVRDISQKSYTVNTLCMLNEKFKSERTKLFLIIGADNLLDLTRWKDPEKLFELSEVIVINRPNYEPGNSESVFAEKVKFVDVPYLDISSSMIREYVRIGRPVKYLVTKEVEEYIEENNLYIM